MPDESPAHVRDILAPLGKGHRQPPWTREQAILAGKAGKGVKRPRTVLAAINRILKRPATSGLEGETKLDDIARALVKACESGDVAAIKLLIERRDGPLVKRHQHEHRAAVSLIDRSGDPRARTVDVSKPSAIAPASSAPKRIENTANAEVLASSSNAAESIGAEQLAAGGSQVGGERTADGSDAVRVNPSSGA